jgi:hypothetical protein
LGLIFDVHPSLAEFQAANSPARPLSKLRKNEQDEILVALANRIAELVRESK